MCKERTCGKYQIPLDRIAKAAKKLEGMTVRPGTKHPYIMVHPSMEKSCPVAKTSDAKKMIVPWIMEATGYDHRTVYQGIRKGKW